MMQKMPVIAIAVGAALVLVAIVGFLVGGGDSAARTALIPAVFGVPLAICGVIGTRGDTARKHAMHAAAAIALLGMLAVIPPFFIRVLPGEASALAIFSVVSEFVLCAAFLGLAVKSFVDARRARQAGGKPITA